MLRRFIAPAAMLVALAALAALAGAAGCGGASEEDFERSVVQARDRVDSSMEHITANPSGREELLSRMERASLEIDKAAEELDRTRAPGKFRDESEQLVGALRQLAVDLSATAEQIRDPAFEDYLSGTQGLSFESWDEVNAVLGKLRRQGVDVPALERH